METNLPLLSRKVSQPPQYAQKISQPAPVVDFNSVSRRSLKSSKKPLLIVEASLKTDILTKNEAIVLICDSMGRSEIWG